MIDDLNPQSLKSVNKNVLLVEDHPSDAILIQEMLFEVQSLSSMSSSFEVIHVKTLKEALSSDVTAKNYDIILLDLTLPDARGLDLFDQIHSHYEDTPVIIFTVLDDEETAIHALKRGAQDYLVKGTVHPELFGRSIHYAIERQQLNREKKTFMMLTSHELKTPACLISGYAELLLLQEKNLSPTSQEMLKHLVDGVFWIASSVDLLIEGVQINACQLHLQYEPIFLKTLLDEVLAWLKPFFKERNLEIKMDENLEKLPVIKGDRKRLWQVLINLIGNAVKFTPDCGKISISGKEQKGFCQMSFYDNGIGIPEFFLERIFEPFCALANPMNHSSSKTHFLGGGMGLGLTICRGIMTAHNGKIWAESRGENQGSTFHLTLPCF